jgi:hypothetical protein
MSDQTPDLSHRAAAKALLIAMDQRSLEGIELMRTGDAEASMPVLAGVIGLALAAQVHATLALVDAIRDDDPEATS